ncbi:hypothetical protein MMPV_009016 [Pyropia vietnamensis]
MGDRHPPIPFRAVAVSWDEGDDNATPSAPVRDPAGGDPAVVADPATSVDIAPTAGAAAVTSALAAAPLVRVNLAAAGGPAALSAAVDGTTAIVAALSSRQPSYARWAAAGATATAAAAAAAGVRRVVVLSSMGIGQPDPLPVGALKLFWTALLATFFRAVREDLIAAEAVWAATPPEVDYLLFRPMGLTPTEPPRGRDAVKLLSARGEGGLVASVAKADVAAAMLDEALNPTAHRTGVTVGYPVK